MHLFIKKNKIITLCFGTSFLICIFYVISRDKKEWFPYAGEWFSLLFQISIGFIVNFFFYVTQIYIPQLNRNREVNRCIGLRVEEIVRNMRSVFSELAKLYMENYDEEKVTDVYMFSLLKKVNLNDKVACINVRKLNTLPATKDANYTVKEWMHSRISLVESEIDKLMKYYAPYINTELMKTLEDILGSSMHHNLVGSLIQIPVGIRFDEANSDVFFKPYYDLMKKLEIIESQYKC